MLVIFDCDGVLINSEEMALESDCEFFATFGLNFTTEEYIEFASGLVYEETLKRLDERHRQIHGGRGLPDDFDAQLRAHYRDTVYPKIRAIDGIVEVLEMLKRHNIPFCVASNSGLDSLHEKLEMTGLKPYFEGRIFSKDMVDYPKPAGDLFIRAADVMGFAPDECLVVEDSVTGVTAICNAGMRGIGFCQGSHRPATYPQTLKNAGMRGTLSHLRETAMDAKELGAALRRGLGLHPAAPVVPVRPLPPPAPC